MEAIILAGGLGTRLAERVQGLPKVMAPVVGRPFLEILLRQLGGAGFSRVILCVGYLHQVIEQHFGDSFGGLSIDYAVEETLLGTGGAIRNALAMTTEDAALVLNGDTFLDADYARMMSCHHDAGATMTMAINRQPDIARYGGVVLSDGWIVGFQEKGSTGPGWINAGAYVLNRDITWPADIGEKFSFEKDFLAPAIENLRPYAFVVDGFFLDIGVPQDYDRAQVELARF